MDYVTEGKVYAVLAAEGGIGSRTGKQWRKQVFVVEEQDRDRHKIVLELWNAHIEQFGGLLKEGAVVRCRFMINGTRATNGRWFSGMQAYYVEAVAENATTAAAAPSVTTGSVLEAAVEEVTEVRSIDELRATLANQFSINKK